MKRILVIFNPVARGAKARAVRQFLDRRAGPGVTLAPTQGPGDAIRLAATDHDHDLIVAAGGDGTVNEVVNGLAGRPLGILPFGTVNVFAKELGIPARLEAAWRVLETGRLRTVDLGCAEFAGQTRYFVQLAGVGFDARAVRATTWNLKTKLGPLSYVVTGVKLLRQTHAPVEVAPGLAGVAVLVGNGRLSMAGLYPAIVIMLREILVSGLREYLAGLRIGLPVTSLAKWKTGFQMGALGTLLAGDSTAVLLHIPWLPVALIGEAMLWGAALLTLVTGWDYLTAGLRHAGTSPPGAVRE